MPRSCAIRRDCAHIQQSTIETIRSSRSVASGPSAAPPSCGLITRKRDILDANVNYRSTSTVLYSVQYMSVMSRMYRVHLNSTLSSAFTQSTPLHSFIHCISLLIYHMLPVTFNIKCRHMPLCLCFAPFASQFEGLTLFFTSQSEDCNEYNTVK